MANTAKKLTKPQRIEAKMSEGMSRIDAEMAVNDEMYAEERRKLRARKSREQTRVDARVLQLVKTTQPDLYEELRSEAEVQMKQEAAERGVPKSAPAAEIEQPQESEAWDQFREQRSAS